VKNIINIDAWIEEQNLFKTTQHQKCVVTDTTPGGRVEAAKQ